MRWIKKHQGPPAESRIVKRFLFFPKCLKNKEGLKEYRWLEFANIKQIQAIMVCEMDVFGYISTEWVD